MGEETSVTETATVTETTDVQKPDTTKTEDAKYTQADLDRLIGEARRKARPSDYEDAKAKAKRLDDLEQAQASDLEKAVNAAKAETRAEVTGQVNSRLVASEARALAAAQRFRDPSDAVKFLDMKAVGVTEDGEVDASALTDLLKDLAKTKPYLLNDDKPVTVTAADVGVGVVGSTAPPATTPGMGTLRSAFASKPK